MADHAAIDHTGLTGVGTADAIPESIVAAKGDIIGASANDTPAITSVGSNGSYLRAASGQSTGLEWQKNNLAASAAPGTGDDAGDGYSVGSIWIDTTGDAAYICVDSTTSSAVWLPFDSASGESWEGAWSAGTYTTGQIVEHGDVIYQANTSTTDEPPGTDWDVLYTAPSGGVTASDYITVISGESNLLQYWPLNETSGTSFADALGGTALTVTSGEAGCGGGTLTHDWGNGGSVVLVNGVDRISMSPITWPAAWSIEAWMVIGRSATDVWLLGQWNSSGAMVYLLSSGNVRIYSGATNATWAAGSAAAVRGRHHIVLTHDGTTERLWWDGTNVVSQTVGSPTSTAGTAFGVLLGGAGSCPISVSDIALWDTALNSTRVNDHYSLGNT